MATSRARLGVMVVGLTPELREHFGAPRDKGVMIGRVEAKSAAATAGLKVGDIITDVKGTAVDSANDVLDTLANVAKNASVTLAVIRDRKPLTLSAKLDSDPAPRVFNWPRWFDFEDWFTERERDKTRT
jgi:S1-C subfamily serine protease